MPRHTSAALAAALLVAASAPARADEPPPRPVNDEPRVRAVGPARLEVSAYADLRLRWSAGRLEVLEVSEGRYPTPTTLQRFVGNFVARAETAGRRPAPASWAVEFNFPLTADADAGSEAAMDRLIRGHVTATTTVRVPLPPGAESVLVEDRRGRARLRVPIRGRPDKSADQPGSPAATAPRPAADRASRR